MGILSGGLFVYKNYLVNKKAILSSSLLKVRNSFDKDTIAELELYDKRSSASKQVLASHIVLSPMFKLLGELTIPLIQYTDFSHQLSDKGFFVKMKGVSRDYKSIALQADVFNTARGRSFKNVVFSNLTKDKNNNVSFDIEFTVDPALLSYEKNNALEASFPVLPNTNNSNPQNQPPVQVPADPNTNLPIEGNVVLPPPTSNPNNPVINPKQ